MNDMKIPLIDCSPIAEWAFEDVPIENYDKVAREIGVAMIGFGMCNLVNHGVSKEKIEEIYKVSKKFFDLPAETKLKYRKISPKISYFGYSCPGDELQMVNKHVKNSTELKESWDIWGLESYDENFYPNNEVRDFKAAFDNIRGEVENVGKKLLRCIEMYLGLEDGALISSHTNLGDRSVRTQTKMRTLNYFVLNPNDNFLPNAIRLGEHSDWGTITLLIQNMVPGLEVKTSEGEWIDATPVQDAILLSSGQLLEYLTGGRFHAAPHRVRIITEGKITREPRQSFVYFINPDGQTNVSPILPVLAKKESIFAKYNNQPINAYDHYQRLIENVATY